MERGGGAIYYEILSGVGVGALVVVGAGAAFMAFYLRMLLLSWTGYMEFLEPPETRAAIEEAARYTAKSTEERAREVDGRVPGTPSAALEETDGRRNWDDNAEGEELP